MTSNETNFYKNLTESESQKLGLYENVNLYKLVSAKIIFGSSYRNIEVRLY